METLEFATNVMANEACLCTVCRMINIFFFLLYDIHRNYNRIKPIFIIQ